MNESEPNLDEKKASNNYLLMMNETEQAKKFGGIKENEILDFDREPKDFSKGVLKDYSESKTKSEHRPRTDGRRHHRSRSTENVPENAESISKLVDEYFKKQFDKNTFD